MARETLLEHWYAAIRAGDAVGLGAVTTDDVTVTWNGPAGLVPWAGRFEGRERVLAFFGLVTQYLEVLSIETLDRVESEQVVAIVLAGRWRIRETGHVIEARAVNLFRFSADRIAAYEVYPDSYAFATALARNLATGAALTNRQ